MRVHNLVQGSAEWISHRSQFHNASDAPAMMGCSTYKTRSQLLQEVHTGLTAEVDAGTQRRFDDGHRFEALARPLAEEIIGEDLYPVVGTDGSLGASFDGLTMDNSINFEHKTLNADLRTAMVAGCTGADLPLQYRVQMEQQMLVSGAEKTLFMASTWMGDELQEERDCWYLPDLELRAKIVAGWAQFEIDLAAYVPGESVVDVVGRTPDNLPALHIEVTGAVTASNLAQYKDHALSVFKTINRELKTDQQFADAEKAVKWCGDVEGRANAAWDHALAQTASIDELRVVLFSVRDEARAVRLELEKLIEDRKKSIRADIVGEGQKAIADHIDGLNKRLGKSYMPYVSADFNGAIKGKRTIESLQSAVSTVLANSKIAANVIADRIQINLASLRELAVDHVGLFPDTAQIVLKENADLVNLIKARIDSDKEEKAKAAAKAALATVAAPAPVAVVQSPVLHSAAPPAAAPVVTVAAPTIPTVSVVILSAMRQALNDHLDTLADEELERVLRFCQSRYPLQQAA